MTTESIRHQIFEMLKAALGEPEVSTVRSGKLYRWTLTRHNDVNMYITMDSPEREDLAHIMISDSEKRQSKPIESTIVYTLDQAEKLIQHILSQWRRTT